MQPQSPTQSASSTIASGAQDLKSQLNGKASSVVNSALSAAGPMASQLSERFEDVRGNAVEYYDFTMDYFKRHPGRCLATGAALGLAAGLLLRSRK
ncbi:MAG: hypothetical protein H7061_08755 [Bdellovibrionaceae bacterium]|nr:hypothetical protein [Bdellovibrio sp.]